MTTLVVKVLTIFVKNYWFLMKTFLKFEDKNFIHNLSSHRLMRAIVRDKARDI